MQTPKTVEMSFLPRNIAVGLVIGILIYVCLLIIHVLVSGTRYVFGKVADDRIDEHILYCVSYCKPPRHYVNTVHVEG